VPGQNTNLPSNQVYGLADKSARFVCQTGFMMRLLRLLPIISVRFFRSRRDLLLENLALRQQLGVFKKRHPQPRFAVCDKFFRVILRRFWPRWKQALILVQPETIVRRHRAGFKLCWTWLSRHRIRAERKPTSTELRDLIFRMVAEKQTWGAPRIHCAVRSPSGVFPIEDCSRNDR